MLYPQSHTPQLSPELFAHPTSEYRATPFWAWNGALEEDELLRQVSFFKKMGLGGFHMHVRSGLSTPYLSDDFMHLIRSCTEQAKKEQMLAWLYDEDRWASGAAGGLVTKDPAFRQRYIVATQTPREENDRDRLLWVYDVQLDANDCLASAERIGADDPAKGMKWYVYREITKPTPWFNNQGYVDTLNKKAIDRFIEITHERYLQTVGDEFGKTVPAIFTDEPQFSAKQTLSFARPNDAADEVHLPWTDDLPETFFAAYGEDLGAHLPELLWELPDGKVSTVRYHYHDFLTERFTEAFGDNVGKWCSDHGIALTGHMMEEPTLHSQTHAIGEAMRAYRGFELPGIDMLCSNKEYTTAKQAQSAVHQFGREGMTSELYGVTGWDFDFRGHKVNGDWQAALGVTVRVPHLSWYTMKGEAKRDYPASIHYQSSWAEEYRLVEDHFARVNTALTRGKPSVRVAVVHPIESYWLHWGPSIQTASVREQLDNNFQNITKWLLLGLIDFDFVCESLLPQLCPQGGNPLRVGEMAYDVVIVPECETLRSSTLERLEQYRAAGGRLIFLGNPPTLENALPSARGKALFERSEQLPFARAAVLDALESVRVLDIRTDDGRRTDDLLHQFRDDNGARWLFIARGTESTNPNPSECRRLHITIRGEYRPTLYNTQTGEIGPIDYVSENGKTMLTRTMYCCDSLLLRLEPGTGARHSGHRAAPETRPLPVPETVRYTLSEPNVLLLDTAEVAVDGGAFEPEEELLRAFGVCCKKLHLDWENAHVMQPWAYGEADLNHTATLRFRVHSTIPVAGAHFALENAALSHLRVNGEDVPMAIDGYFTDRSISTVPIPALPAGESIIEVDTPIGAITGLEWCYLLGSFGVQVHGRRKELVALPDALGFDDVAVQQLPFYGANVTYHIPVQTHGGVLHVETPYYAGALVRVAIDSKDAGAIIYPPCTLTLADVPAGAHTVDITLFGSRQNCFGPVHRADQSQNWVGPNAWRETGDAWTYEYRLHPMGLLSSPKITEEV